MFRFIPLADPVVSLCVASLCVASLCPGANLAVSTYFRDGFTPSAMTSDAAGNLYIAGTVPLDPESPGATAAVAKLDPMATQYLYLAYLDAAASDSISAIAVDSAGNAYLAGSTTNTNFPSVGGAQLGTPPTSAQDPRSFVVKFDSSGAVVFSVLIGGSAASEAMGIALTSQGQILVSGIAAATGFPATAGAYSVANSANQWFLMELDPTASQMIFSATGIGGSSIALDGAGNSYLAGSSGGMNYPTTPGAYQTTFVQGHICFGLCQIGFNGVLQHVTKVDPAATKLIYSTGLNDLTGAAGSTTNTGLAVDAAGNAYVTGTLLEALYPFTVPTPQNYYGFLTKLDAGGDSLLFSIPVGGAGVPIDSTGAVYVGGVVSSYDPVGFGVPITPLAPPPVFSWIPQPCWPNNIVAISEAYVMKIDPNSGNVEDAQWVDGSAPIATALTLASGKAWIVGTTPAPDVPFTPGVLSPRNIGPGFTAGAFLAAADFSSSPGTGPAIACVLELLVVRNGYTATFVDKVDPTRGPAPNAILATRAPVNDLGRVVRGRVVDPHGRPLRAAVITPQGVSTDQSSMYGTIDGLEPIAVTNSNGEFELAYNHRANGMLIQVEARGMAPKVVAAPTGAERTTITVSDGAVVRGRLLNHGKPAAGVQLGLFPEHRAAFGAKLKIFGDPYEEVRIGTQPDGSFVITNVPAPVDWYVYGKMESIAALGATVPIKLSTKRDGEEVNVGDIEIQKGYQFSGRVTLSNGAVIANGMRMTIGAKDGFDTQTVLLSPEGRFEFHNVPRGDYEISPSVRGYSLPGGKFTVDVTVDQDRNDFDVTLDPAPRR